MGINSKRPRSPHRTHLASFTAIKSRKENLKVECFTIAYMVMQHNTLKVQAAKNQGKLDFVTSGYFFRLNKIL